MLVITVNHNCPLFPPPTWSLRYVKFFFLDSSALISHFPLTLTPFQTITLLPQTTVSKRASCNTSVPNVLCACVFHYTITVSHGHFPAQEHASVFQKLVLSSPDLIMSQSLILSQYYSLIAFRPISCFLIHHAFGHLLMFFLQPLFPSCMPLHFFSYYFSPTCSSRIQCF